MTRVAQITALHEKIARREQVRLAVQRDRDAAAALRAEIRRLHYELNPPPQKERELSAVETRDALRVALRAKKDGDPRSPRALLEEAVADAKARSSRRK